MYSIRTLLLIAALTTSNHTSVGSPAFGQQLPLDTQIETPAQNNSALELPEKQAGETIQFQLFLPGASGRQIQGYTVELALRGKTIGSYIGDVSGTDLNGGALLSRVSGTGNPTLSMLSVSAVTIPASGYLGQVNLRASRALTSSDVLAVQSASTAGPGGVQNLDVSQAVLTFAQAPACPGDFNGDGLVNLADFLAFAGGFGTRSGDANYDARIDLDGNGAVDLTDFLAFAGVFGTTCPVPPSPPVSIPDANLRAVIEDSLGKARGAEITRAEMATLTRLEAQNMEISDLTGLEFATGVTWLDLMSNSITDVSSLSGLINLVHLNLAENNITDVSLLSGLGNLTALNLRFNNIKDVSSLSALTNLAMLKLGANDISDVSSLSSLTNLEELDFFKNSISDASPLSALARLTLLDLAFTRVSDVSALSGLTNLTKLRLSLTDITDVSLLSGLINLTELGLAFTYISDVSPLSGLTNLTVLRLQSCSSVSDFSPLAELINLEALYLSETGLTDL
ncbi:MAG: hypothetical protein OXU79_21175 [Gemmatimonadota bacterium]|nr:hypothetical protein [Gemmatimonadota bacterium]